MQDESCSRPRHCESALAKASPPRKSAEGLTGVHLKEFGLVSARRGAGGVSDGDGGMAAPVAASSERKTKKIM